MDAFHNDRNLDSILFVSIWTFRSANFDSEVKMWELLKLSLNRSCCVRQFEFTSGVDNIMVIQVGA